MVKNVVAFIGRAGAGKTEQATLLVKNSGYKKLSYADSLRNIIRSVLGFSYEEFNVCYNELKKIEIYNGQTLRNMMENLGSKIRYYDSKYFIKALQKEIACSTYDYICIDDLRYIDEYFNLYQFCKEQNIELKVIFCNYHSDRYQETNPHESAFLSNRLCELGYKDLQELTKEDIDKIVEEVEW